MVLFDQRANLRTDSGAIKAHHEQLTHLPVGGVMVPASAMIQVG